MYACTKSAAFCSISAFGVSGCVLISTCATFSIGCKRQQQDRPCCKACSYLLCGRLAGPLAQPNPTIRRQLQTWLEPELSTLYYARSASEPSRAEPSRAEPSRAEPSRAEPSQLDNFLILNQISSYTEQITTAAGQGLQKLYAMEGLQKALV
jgi:hypothetical protein